MLYIRWSVCLCTVTKRNKFDFRFSIKKFRPNAPKICQLTPESHDQRFDYNIDSIIDVLQPSRCDGGNDA